MKNLTGDLVTTCDETEYTPESAPINLGDRINYRFFFCFFFFVLFFFAVVLLSTACLILLLIISVKSCMNFELAVSYLLF